ncbi:sensor histidine kinase [Kitasatospora viridis]|uniref:histidine kinase n=1 Tax=Kitasatospora viridis TaxID=281105 RepID=A0A561TW66_9ACTN|nr:histidine kinase [Kitasatospora viridis]TWF91349.1 signal transduction histidine kinase [Kitasatospora viridis]
MPTPRRRPSAELRQAFNRRDLIGAAALVACGAVSVLAAPGPLHKIVVGVLMACAELGMLLGRRYLSWVGGLGAALTIASGLTVTLLAPGGLGEVAVLVGVLVLPLRIPAGPLSTAALMVVSLASGVTIMAITGSAVGLLAGVGTWLMANRSVDQVILQAERDRAVGLLAEVEASRLALREAAATEERNRIAKEMHDVLAHTLAGLSMQLQAIRAIAGREGAPAALTGPLDRAAELARDGVQEARAAVGALRASALRGPDDLAALVRDFPGDAELEVSGPVGRVDRETGHAVYRAVQEAMTNAARYATGSPIRVQVSWLDRELRVTVRDHGRPAGRQPSPVQGSGTGLRTMAERIEAVDGTVAAGPAPGGPGWLVDLRVPSAG